VKFAAAAGLVIFVVGLVTDVPVVVGIGAALFAFVALWRWKESP
jgi:hypothetical protein